MRVRCPITLRRRPDRSRDSSRGVKGPDFGNFECAADADKSVAELVFQTGVDAFGHGAEIVDRPRKTRFCSDERGRLGLRRGVGFDFGGEDGQY